MKVTSLEALTLFTLYVDNSLKYTVGQNRLIMIMMMYSLGKAAILSVTKCYSSNEKK